MGGRDEIKVNVKRRLSEAKMYVSDTMGNHNKKKGQSDSHKGYWLSQQCMYSSSEGPPPLQ